MADNTILDPTMVRRVKAERARLSALRADLGDEELVLYAIAFIGALDEQFCGSASTQRASQKEGRRDYWGEDQPDFERLRVQLDSFAKLGTVLVCLNDRLEKIAMREVMMSGLPPRLQEMLRKLSGGDL